LPRQWPRAGPLRIRVPSVPSRPAIDSERLNAWNSSRSRIASSSLTTR
jgi:hypothetical protein